MHFRRLWQKIKRRLSSRRYCDACNSDVKTVVREAEESFNVKGEGFIQHTHNVRFCQVCDNSISDNELDAIALDSVYQIYREEHAMLTSKEVLKIRKKTGLSQEDFAKKYGILSNMKYIERGALHDKEDEIIFRKIIDGGIQ